MKSRGICGRQKGRYRVQPTDSNHDHPIAPNHLTEAPKATAPNQIWIADIAYVPTAEDCLDLAGLLDLHSPRIVGWAVRPSIDSALVLAGVAVATLHRTPRLGLLFYAAGYFRATFRAAGLVASMNRRGNCYDNASINSFRRNLKLELVYSGSFTSHIHARSEIFEFIEVFYNRQRRHTSLGGLSSSQFKLKNN